MRCPKCSTEDIGVLDTRHLPDRIRRRRCCWKCEHRWTTYEIAETELRYNRERDLRKFMEKAYNEILKEKHK